MALGLILLRRRPDLKRDYHIWGYPIVPAIFIFSSFAIVINKIISEPRESIYGLLLVATGVPVYYLFLRKEK